MLVIFSVFIVYKDGCKRRASMIEDSINVLPVNKGKDVNPDYHSHFTAQKFEQFFEKICKSFVLYGNCIIHMDGASYHKRQSCTYFCGKKYTIVEWSITKRKPGLASGDFLHYVTECNKEMGEESCKGWIDCF